MTQEWRRKSQCGGSGGGDMNRVGVMMHMKQNLQMSEGGRFLAKKGGRQSSMRHMVYLQNVGVHEKLARME